MRTGWVCLGRYGDICNALPLLLHDYQEGNRPTLIVSKEYAGIADGIGYADKIVWDKHYSKPMDAVDWATKYRTFSEIYVPQCYGQSFTRQCPNFCQEAWRLCGREHLWGALPLVFDRRNKEREKALLYKGTKPVVLVATKALSHPFPHRDKLWEALQPLRDTKELIDLSEIKAERFYDLIGLMEQAEYLVTVDTGILHLARAVPKLPVITLIPGNAQTWDVAPAFPQHILRIYFDELERRKPEIPEAIQRGVKPQWKFVHVWSKYEIPNLSAQRRHTMAKVTWEKEMKEAWTEVAVTEADVPRTARTEFADPKNAPFILDLIDKAMAKANPWDVIVLTNDDTCVAPGLTQQLRVLMKEQRALWSARREHRVINRPLTPNQVMQGRKHVGADLFAFTKEWWQEHGGKMPDMLLAFENWDYVLRTIIECGGGIEVEGLCYHEIHQGDWTKRREAAAAKHNQAMGAKFFEAIK